MDIVIDRNNRAVFKKDLKWYFGYVMTEMFLKEAWNLPKNPQFNFCFPPQCDINGLVKTILAYSCYTEY